MTLAEFKAWFEGFTEDMDGAPNAKQWKRIKERVKQVDGVALTAQTVVHHWPYYPQRYWTSPLIGLAGQNVSAAAQAYNAAVNVVDLGRADYAELKAA